MTIEISVDDGSWLDMKAALLLEKYGFKGIFFIPVLARSIAHDRILYLAENHEVGCHTITHPRDLKMLTPQGLDYEIRQAKEDLEDLTRKPVTKFCYPRGRFNEDVKRVVEDVGFTYARTARVGRTELSNDPFEVDTTFHLYDRKEYNGKDLLVYFTEKLEEAKQKPNGYFHMWLHSEEISDLGYWNLFEEMLQLLKRT